jgi:putative membrane protein
MARFLFRLIINTTALWLTTLIVDGVKVVSYGSTGDTVALVLTYLLVGGIFGIVNSIIGNAIRIVAFPLYIVTLGLIALVVNGLLLLLVANISSLLGFGLTVDGIWWGVLGALVLGLLAWLIGVLLRPFIRRKRN